MTSLISAVIATYAASRLIWRILAALPPTLRLIAAHGLSLGALTLFVGLNKAYFNSFAVSQTYVLIAPQLVWLIVDALRGKAATPSVRASRL